MTSEASLPDGDGEIDLRVAAALAVLSGVPLDSVATSLGVETAIVSRWSDQFLEGGRRAVTNRPDPAEAARRDRFLVVLSHELRTPLTVLKASGPLFASLPERLRPASDALVRAIGRIEGLADLFAEAAAASLGRLPIRSTVLDLRALVGDPDPDGEPLLAHADPQATRTILTDLLGAAGHGQPDLVVVETRTQEGWAEVAVVRRPGLGFDHVAGLLDPFDVSDDASEVTLGLYRARALAVAMGGQLGARGDEDHTELWVRLPPADRPVPTRETSDPLTERGSTT